MSGILGTAVTGAGAVSYTIDKSVRLRASATGYFSRTLASSGNTNQWTFSTWLKRGALAATSGNPYQYVIFAAGTFGSVAATNALFYNAADSVLQFYIFDGSSFQINGHTSAVFRDPSAWYHIVVNFDGQNNTAADRVKIYVNNVQYTLTYDQNAKASSYINNSSYTQLIGRDPRPGTTYENPFDGYLAETQFVNAQLLTPSSFGETNSSTGVWQPKAYTGTYGTNGFYLKYTDVATTSGSNAGLGKDFSGNGNYWNTNNISVTAGTTYDSMKDSPTNTSATVANYCTFNPLNATVQTLGAQVLDVSQANLYAGLRNTILMGTMGGRATGKYYWEITLGNSEFVVGVATPQINLNAAYPRYVGQGPYGWGYGPSNGYCYNNGSLVTATGVTATTGDVIGIAIDLANQKMFVSKNGTWMNSGNPETGAGAVFTNISNTDYVIPCFSDGGGASAVYGYFNAGQRPFSYTAPTGYVCLNSNNLPTPTIGTSSTTQANRYFDANLWTGDGTTGRVISNLNFQPDFVWIKERSSTGYHVLDDAIRGAGKILASNATDAEATDTTAFNAFNSNGFTVGNSGSYYTNRNTQTYVGWNWKGNGSGSSNTSGSITSTVSANTTAGFSIVTWTGVGGLGTVGHGLGVAPKMIIVMPRSFVSDKYVYNASIGAANYLSINLTSASAGTTLWNSTAPTNSVFTVNGNGANQNTSTYVAYCFAEIAGYSKIGSYIGNGSNDGPMIYTGFKPRWFMLKETNTTTGRNSWFIIDSARNTYNVLNSRLGANLSDAEASDITIADFVSNGVKIRNSNWGWNENNATYIYMAFAETPFNYSLAR